MSITPISGVGGVGGPAGVGATGGASRVGAAAGDFGSSITDALEQLDRMHGRADQMATRAATGDLESVTDYLVAATEAQLATQVTVAVRNRAVEAFNDIMRMQV